ncbi:2-alkenal reductase [Rhodobacteraceae bacterium WD3A24]|nr:2-alkenal reductase [Rhodobacteraceae bacterium WD3A24]
MPPHARKAIAIVTAAAVIGAAALLAMAAAPSLSTQPRSVTPRGALTPSEETTIALFEQTRASVVSITTAGQVFDPWTRRTQQVPRGTGSGFVWDEAGHVVTNNHVIEGASGARVALADGRSLPARLVGTAPSQDIAVLRIDPEGEMPPPLPIGRSADLQVGQSVLAIGNPFGLDWTLTTGVVSALDRELPRERGPAIDGLIQTDAAINPGNSGGPLIDSAGRLIGMNTAIYSPSGSSAGIGFAVPVDTVNRVVPQIIETGRYSPPTLGVVHDARINALARQRGIEGVLVLGVRPGSPAEEAGLRPARRGETGGLVAGDIIIGLDGRDIATSDELRGALDDHAPGDEVELRLLRDGREISVKVALAPPD